ncbi:MAG TPA: hypothetical protein VF283_08250, partial [Bryobacteraceae bacterium]
MIPRLRFILAGAAVCLLSAPAFAATTTTWQTSGLSAFLKGRLSALSLTADGVLEPGPAPLFQAQLGQPVVWSIARAPGGSVYAATGHDGKLFRISPAGKVSTFWTAPEPEIFALAVTPDGTVYAATSPNGGVYRLHNRDRKGAEATEIWHCPAKYIWALQTAPDGGLFVATGQPGRVYRISANGATSLYYDTGQENVTALKLAPDGRLYAGSDPNGLLYRISAARRATVLLDSDLPEIRAIVLAPGGAVYVAGTGGAVATRSSSQRAGSAFSASALGVSPTVITVTAASKNTATATTTSPQSEAAQAAAARSQTETVTEVSGAERSAIYRIEPDRTVETLHTSKQYNIYGMLLEKGSVIFSTDDHGRIYSLAGDGGVSLLAEPGPGQTTRLLMHGSTLYAALSNPARLIALGPAGSVPGKYESQVHDCKSVAARWGHVHWHGQGSGIIFYTRTGNSARPDTTWSVWSPLAGDLIQSPPGRFVQWRAEFPARAGLRVDSVGIPYLPQNAPPMIHSIAVTSVLGTNATKTGTADSSSNSAYSVTVTDTGDAPDASSASDAVTRLQSTQVQIVWQADDPDNDKLVYAVYFRAEGEKKWQLIRNRMFANT